MDGNKKILEKISHPEEVVAPAHVRRKRFLRFRYLMVLFAISFAVLAVLAKFNPYFKFDLLITHFIQNIRFPYWHEFMSFISYLGTTTVGSVSVLFFCILFLYWNQKKNALFIVFSTVGATIISLIMKSLVGRPRPPAELLLNFPGVLKDHSFPSGHVLFFMGFYGFLLFLAYAHITRSALRTTLMLICMIMLVLIGISRIYLGAHWFSDTLGSYLIGTIWIYFLIHLYKRINY